MEEAKDPNMSSVCVSDDPNMHRGHKIGGNFI